MQYATARGSWRKSSWDSASGHKVSRDFSDCSCQVQCPLHPSSFLPYYITFPLETVKIGVVEEPPWSLSLVLNTYLSSYLTYRALSLVLKAQLVIFTSPWAPVNLSLFLPLQPSAFCSPTPLTLSQHFYLVMQSHTEKLASAASKPAPLFPTPIRDSHLTDLDPPLSDSPLKMTHHQLLHCIRILVWSGTPIVQKENLGKSWCWIHALHLKSRRKASQCRTGRHASP